MTRKQALHKALKALANVKEDFMLARENQEAIEKIHEILEELPFTGWSERTIFDTIDQFVLDHGRNPTATDFIPKGMPPHPVIKLRFGMTLGEFLRKHYPQPKVNRKEQKQLFISEYNRIKPKGACDFNEKKADNIPTWGTFARMFGKKRWLEWLDFCGIEKSSQPCKKRKSGAEVKVISHNDLLIKFEAIPPTDMASFIEKCEKLKKLCYERHGI